MTTDTLQADVERAVATYERLNHQVATRTRQMIERLGTIEALSQLMVSADLQQGFKVLRDRKELDKSFEAVVTRHSDSFAQGVVEAAQWRLDNPHDLL